jgi:hypothetical protein
VGTLTGPAYVEFTFPTEGGGTSDLVVSGNAPLELVPTRTGFIDQSTFVTHGEIIRADGTRVARPRLDGSDSRAFVDVAGTAEGARDSVLKLARYSTYLAFAIGVELAARLPSYMKFRRNAKGESLMPVFGNCRVHFFWR